ncbi:MAG: hypothetical protein II744_06330 [Eubacterium sp.]|nr:hypothetical protein [Eubacterium sp.]
MELNEIFKALENNLKETNNQLGFKKAQAEGNELSFASDSGVYRLVHDSESNILSFECAYTVDGETGDFSTVSRLLLDPADFDEREARSTANEIIEEIERLFKVKKQVNLDKVKMPKSVSRTKAKNGIISYDVDSLANRFGALYPEFKDIIKQNVVDYGEFLPETFFTEHGNAKVLDVIKSGNEAEQKKLFKMLGEIFEDGTNEVQDIIAVTILGEMKNDKEMMAVADKYMTEYMSGPVHEVNKLTSKNNRFTKKLKNPPAYKPKKRKSFSLANTLNSQQQ